MTGIIFIAPTSEGAAKDININNNNKKRNCPARRNGYPVSPPDDLTYWSTAVSPRRPSGGHAAQRPATQQRT